MGHPDVEPFPEEVLELSGIISIADQIKKELEEFKPNLPLIVGLRSQGMRQRQVGQISAMATEKSGGETEVEVSPVMADLFCLDSFLKSGLKIDDTGISMSRSPPFGSRQLTPVSRTERRISRH